MRLRFVAGGLIALLATVSLTSCAPAPLSASRSVGDCWQVSAGEAQQALRATDVGSEKCDGDALAITYHVAPINAAALSDYLTEQVNRAVDLADLPIALSSRVLSDCETELIRAIPGSNRDTLRSSRVVWDFSLPSEKDWKAGARWFSCELSVVAYGSTSTAPVWTTFNDELGKLTAQVRDIALELCIDTATNEESPLSMTAVVVTCTAPRWMLKQQKLRIASGDFYPGVKKAQSIATNLCEAKYETALAVVAAPLTEAVWNAKTPTVGCWVSKKPNPEDPAAESARIAAEQAAVAEEAARQMTIQQSARARYWRPAQSQDNSTPPNPSVSEPEPEPTAPAEPEPTAPAEPERSAALVSSLSKQRSLNSMAELFCYST